jgi:hypothetical protein
MELEETTEKKELLARQTEQYKHRLQEEFKSMTQNTEKIVTNAIIIGGTLAITYVIARQFFKTKSKRKAKKFKVVNADPEQRSSTPLERDEEPGLVSQIGSALAAQATVFLLSLAKDKLSAYLQSQFEKEAEPKNEHP